MNKMMILAKAVEGRADELARWYDETHIPELLSVDGVVSAERHALMTVKQPEGMSGWDFMLVYEMDREPMDVLRNMGERLSKSASPRSEALASEFTLSLVGLSRYLRKA